MRCQQRRADPRLARRFPGLLFLPLRRLRARRRRRGPRPPGQRGTAAPAPRLRRRARRACALPGRGAAAAGEAAHAPWRLLRRGGGAGRSGGRVLPFSCEGAGEAGRPPGTAGGGWGEPLSLRPPLPAPPPPWSALHPALSPPGTESGGHKMADGELNVDSLITRLLEGERGAAGSQRARPPLPAGRAGAAGAVRCGTSGGSAFPGVGAGSGLGASRRCPEPRPCSPAEGGGAAVQGGARPVWLPSYLIGGEKKRKKKSLVFHLSFFTPLPG